MSDYKNAALFFFFLLIQVNKIVVEKEVQAKLMLLLKTNLTQLHRPDLDEAGPVLGNLYNAPNDPVSYIQSSSSHTWKPRFSNSFKVTELSDSRTRVWRVVCLDSKRYDFLLKEKDGDSLVV